MQARGTIPDIQGTSLAYRITPICLAPSPANDLSGWRVFATAMLNHLTVLCREIEDHPERVICLSNTHAGSSAAVKTPKTFEGEEPTSGKGCLEPKPPRWLEELKWLLLHGRKHWPYLVIALLALPVPFYLRSLLTAHTEPTPAQPEPANVTVNIDNLNVFNDGVVPDIRFRVTSQSVRVEQRDDHLLPYKQLLPCDLPPLMILRDETPRYRTGHAIWR